MVIIKFESSSVIHMRNNSNVFLIFAHVLKTYNKLQNSANILPKQGDKKDGKDLALLRIAISVSESQCIVIKCYLYQEDFQACQNALTSMTKLLKSSNHLRNLILNFR